MGLPVAVGLSRYAEENVVAKNFLGCGHEVTHVEDRYVCVCVSAAVTARAEDKCAALG